MDNMIRGMGFLALLCASPAQGETYYVSTNGSDANSCATAKSSATPKQTINDAAVNCLSKGDTLLVRDGTYNERLGNNVLPSGSSDAPTILKAENKHGAIFQPI